MKFQIGDTVRVTDPQHGCLGMTGRITYYEDGDYYVAMTAWGVERALCGVQLTAVDLTPQTAAEAREQAA